MKVLGGQVHVVELGLVVCFSFLTLMMGFSLPLLAAILMLTWPLLLIQFLFEGLFWGLVAAVAALWRRGKPPKPAPEPRPPRTGLARYLWLMPLITLTLGYGWYVLNTGKWFL